MSVGMTGFCFALLYWTTICLSLCFINCVLCVARGCCELSFGSNSQKQDPFENNNKSCLKIKVDRKALKQINANSYEL